MIHNYYNYMFYPQIPMNCNLPPTIYTILQSIVNSTKSEDNQVKIKDLAKEGRSAIFNFDYELSENISKEKFETMILNHFLQRRIGFETVTAFRIQLEVKLNEILPIYNKMLDALDGWDIFNDGEKTVRNGSDHRTGESETNSENILTNESNTSTEDIADRRYSDTPQNEIDNLRLGKYVTSANYDKVNNTGHDTSTANGESSSTNKTKDDNIYTETIQRSPSDKITILKEMQENIKSIYTMIFKDLECLFYGLV